MKKWMRDVLAYSIIVGIFGFTFFWFAKEWQTLREINWTARPDFLVCHILFMVATQILFVVGWLAVLRQINVKWSYNRVAASWLVPNLGKYVPGKVGMLLGRVELCHHYGAPRTSCLSAFVFEHVLSFSAAVPFFFVALLFGGEMTYIKATSIVFMITICCLIVLFQPQLLNRFLDRILKFFKKPAVDFQLTSRAITSILPLYLLLWFCYGLSGWTLLLAIGAGDGVPFFKVISYFVMSWLIGFASLLTPGGLGVREAVMVSLLSGYVPFTTAMAVAALARLSWTVIEMLGICLGLLIMRQLPNKSHTQE